MRPSFFRLLVSCAAAICATCTLGCDDNGASGGQQGEVCTNPAYLCATPACSSFPSTPGCDSVSPSNEHCPVDHEHCFDPTDAQHIALYCNPTATSGICAKSKTAPPDGCGSAVACTVSDVKNCYDTTTDNFCQYGWTCVHFACSDGGSDGGVSDGGSNDAAAAGDGAMIDAAAGN